MSSQLQDAQLYSQLPYLKYLHTNIKIKHTASHNK